MKTEKKSQSKQAAMPFIKSSPAVKVSSSELSGLQLILPNGIRIITGNEVNASLLEMVLSIAGGQ